VKSNRSSTCAEGLATGGVATEDTQREGMSEEKVKSNRSRPCGAEQKFPISSHSRAGFGCCL